MKRLCPHSVSLVLLSSLINICDAAESASRTPELAAGSVLTQVLFGLGCVTAAIFAFAWLAKRLGGTRFMQQNCMDIVATMPMGTREKLVLVNVENTKILLGVTSSNITRLHVFDSPVTAEGEDGSVQSLALAEYSTGKTADASAKDDKSKLDFSHYLKQFSEGLIHKQKKPGAARDNSNQTLGKD